MTPAPLSILSAGAPKRGLSHCVEAFSRLTGRQVDVTYATAPVLRSKVERGEASADLVVAPVPIMAGFADKGLTVPGVGAVLGAVKAGVVIRAGTAPPNIGTVSAFKESVLAAQSLVYNEASSGLYIVELMERLGIAEEVAAKTTRLPSAAKVMEHLARSTVAAEIGFGQIPAIQSFTDQGVVLVGPLPDEIGKTTTYEAGVLATAQDGAGELIEFLRTPSARQMLVAAGVAEAGNPYKPST